MISSRSLRFIPYIVRRHVGSRSTRTLAEVARAWGRSLEGIDFARPSRVLAEALENAGVATLDLTPAFQSAAPVTRLYKPRDTHWNVAGNRLASEAIVAVLRESLTRDISSNARPGRSPR